MKKIPTGKIIAFAIGQLGWSLLSGMIVSYLVYFYQPTAVAELPLFIPQGMVLGFLTVVGIIAAFGRLFDAVMDPLIAWFSDRSTHPQGRRIPFLKAAALPFAVSTALVFWSPVPGVSWLNVLWLFIFLTLFYLGVAAYVTPFNALIPELGKTQTERLNISTGISLTFILGTAIAYMAPMLWEALVAQGWDKVLAIRTVFSLMSLVALVCLFVPVIAIREKDYVNSQPVQTSVFASLAGVFRNRQFQIFVSSDIAYWISLALFQTGLPFYVKVLLHLPESMISVLFITMTAASLIFYIPINLLARRIGKKRLIAAAFLLFTLTFLLTGYSGLGFKALPVEVQGYALVILASLPLAIFGILPQAVVADISQYDVTMTGANREGMFFAARTFAFKLGQMLSMVLFTTLLTFGSDYANDYGIRLTAQVACLFCLAGFALFLRYDEKTVSAFQTKEEEKP